MEGRRLKRGKKEESIRGGQSRGKVNKEWGKKQRIVADQERSNKENLSIERQQHKKTSQNMNEAKCGHGWKKYTLVEKFELTDK